MSEEIQRINLDDYIQTGEGGTALTYTRKDGLSLAKLYKPGFEADRAPQAIDEATKRLMPYYAAKVPYMFDMVFSAPMPDAALQKIVQLFVCHGTGDTPIVRF